MKRFLPVLALVTLAAPAAAAEFHYADFEVAVPHLDLAGCPAEMAAELAEPAFCRVTLGHDSLHVFAFAEAGDQPFLALRTYFEEDFEIAIGE